MKRIIAVCTAALLGAAAVWGAEPFQAEIGYLEGEVSVQRQGMELDWADVDIGTELKTYDLVETGADGYAEITVTSPRPMILKVRPNSAVYLSREAAGAFETTEARLLAGTLALKVQKIAQAQTGVVVRTDSMVMGVRGTEFEVATIPDGSLLVSCSEGEVLCEDESARSLAAVPGQVVTKDAQMQPRAFEVAPEDLDAYRSFWRDRREEVFRRSARMIIPAYARRQLRLAVKFRIQYQKAVRHQKQLEELLKDPDLDMARVVTVKRKISADLIRLRSGLNLFEHNFYALQRMAEYVTPELRSEFVSEEYRLGGFMKEFLKDADSVKRQLAVSRHLLRMYGELSRRSGLAVPVETQQFGGNPLDF